MVSQETIDEIRRVSEAQERQRKIEEYDLPTRAEIDRDFEDREPINIHPRVKHALHRLLARHPRFETSGIGYSEFIARAIRRELESD